MSNSIKNFSIFKVSDKKSDKHPDYSISAKVQNNNVDEYKEIGAGYIKEGQKGKFISVALSKPREFNGKQYSGYVIVDEERFNKMEKVYEDYLIQQREPDYPTPTSQGINLEDVMIPKVEITPEQLDINPDDIPF